MYDTTDVLTFSRGTLHRETRAKIDSLLSNDVVTVNDMKKCIQAQYACLEDVAVETTNILLRRWTKLGLVDIFGS